MHSTIELDRELDAQPSLNANSELEVFVDGTLLNLDRDASVFILEVLNEYLSGRAVTATSDNTFFTTQQAADFMGVSRPTLIKLLQDHKTPVQSTGSHRRIRFSDLLILEDQIRDRKTQDFRELIELSEAAGLYDLDHEKNPFVKE